MQHALELFVRVQTMVVTNLRREDGQGLTEYALILALVAIVAIGALIALGGGVTSKLNSTADSLK